MVTVKEIRAVMAQKPTLTLGLLLHCFEKATVADIQRAVKWSKLHESIRRYLIIGFIGPTNALAISQLEKSKQVPLVRAAMYLDPEAFIEVVKDTHGRNSPGTGVL